MIRNNINQYLMTSQKVWENLFYHNIMCGSAINTTIYCGSKCDFWLFTRASYL